MNGQLELLRTLIEEGIHAAADFNVARLEELAGQQEALLRGLTRPLPGSESNSVLSELRELRRAGNIYSRVLVSTWRTAAALNTALHVAQASAPQTAASGEVN